MLMLMERDLIATTLADKPFGQDTLCEGMVLHEKVWIRRQASASAYNDDCGDQGHAFLQGVIDGRSFTLAQQANVV